MNKIMKDVRVVAQRPHGTHFCHFYKKQDEVLELLPPYFAAGIEGSQRCIWALPSWLSAERARSTIAKAGRRLQHALADGTLTVVPQDEVYGDGNGGFKGIDAVIEHWLREEIAALKRGFLGLRVAGDGSWRTKSEGWPNFVKYEQTVDDAIAQTKIAALCTYDLSVMTPEQVNEIMTSHHCGVMRRPEGWEQFSRGR